MAYCKCPLCGGLFHVQLGEPEAEWRVSRGLPPDGFAPEICFRCIERRKLTRKTGEAVNLLSILAPAYVENALWVVTAKQDNPAYDFEFERFFACSHPPTLPHPICAVARAGAFEDYAAAFCSYGAVGIRLIHDPEMHLRCTRLPVWYPILADLTPKSLTVEGALDMDRAERELGWPMFVKGERQTNRHRKALSIANNREDLARILRAFSRDPILGWQRPVFRSFVKLRPVAGGDSEEISPSFEFRTFWWRGQLVGFGRYWTSAEAYDATPAERSAATQVAGEAARRLNATFVVVDVACTVEGRWIVIEPNDGQESGYASVNPLELWNRIIEIERSASAPETGG